MSDADEGEDKDEREEIQSNHSNIIWAIVVLGLIVFLLIVLYILLGFDVESSGLPTKWGPFSLQPTDARLQVISIAASGILSFILIYVYRNIGEIQKKQADQLEGQKDLQEEVNKFQEDQTKILDKQEAWMEAEHKPIISIKSWEATDENVTFELSNFGNGVAKNVTVILRLGPVGGNWPFDEDEIRLEGDLLQEHQAQVLKQSVEPICFEGSATLSQDFEVDQDDITDVLEELNPGDEIYYRVQIGYEDLSDDTDVEDVWVAETEVPDSTLTLPALIDNTTDETSWFRSVTPENLKSP